MSNQITITFPEQVPEKPLYIHDTAGTGGTFGSYKAFPTLLPNVMRGVHIDTLETRYFQEGSKPDYYRYVGFYSARTVNKSTN